MSKDCGDAKRLRGIYTNVRRRCWLLLRRRNLVVLFVEPRRSAFCADLLLAEVERIGGGPREARARLYDRGWCEGSGDAAREPSRRSSDRAYFSLFRPHRGVAKISTRHDVMKEEHHKRVSGSSQQGEYSPQFRVREVTGLRAPRIYGDDLHCLASKSSLEKESYSHLVRSSIIWPTRPLKFGLAKILRHDATCACRSRSSWQVAVAALRLAGNRRGVAG